MTPLRTSLFLLASETVPHNTISPTTTITVATNPSNRPFSVILNASRRKAEKEVFATLLNFACSPERRYFLCTLGNERWWKRIARRGRMPDMVFIVTKTRFHLLHRRVWNAASLYDYVKMAGSQWMIYLEWPVYASDEPLNDCHAFEWKWCLKELINSLLR